MLCPTNCFVDATENREEEAWRPKCSYQTRLRFCTLLQDVYARLRTIGTTKYIQRKTKKVPFEGQVSARICRTACKTSI